MKATIDDLRKEQWLRRRNAGEIKWITKDGKEIPINEMSDSHLENAINCVIKAMEMQDIAAEYAAYVSERFE